jgi:hypothetical protein
MERRTFVKTIVGFFAIVRRPAALARTDAAQRPFPITAQLSSVAGQPPWQSLSAEARHAAVRDAIDAIAGHGFSGIECPLPLAPDDIPAALQHIRSRGLYLDYDRTIDKGGGVDIFVRDKPSPVSVFSPEYAKAVRARVQTALDEARPFAPYRHVFLYQDEPFHAGPDSFDYGDEAKEAFRTRFGYALPADVDSARKDPKVWQDVIEFRTTQFPVGWRQVYRIIKELRPSADVVVTHDSHSTFGAGVGSNSKLAVDAYFTGARISPTRSCSTSIRT